MTTSAAARSPDSAPPDAAPTAPMANGNATPATIPPTPPTTDKTSNSLGNAKRKRTDPVHQQDPPKHQPPSKQKTSDPKKTKEQPAQRLREKELFLTKMMTDLLVVLKEHDPNPSILDRPLTSSSTPAIPGAPPAKRKKLTASTPNTIAEKLSQGIYTSLGPLLSDIANVCGAILATPDPNPALAKTNGVLTNGMNDKSAYQNTGSTVVQAVRFEKVAKDLIRTELLRRADLFDFTQELDTISAIAGPGSSRERASLMVMGQHGPLFTSLQNPVHISTPSGTPATSPVSSTADSPASTAATSVFSSSPDSKLTEEHAVISPLDISTLPVIVTIAYPALLRKAAKSGISGNKDTDNIPTLGEAFPAPRGQQGLSSPKRIQPESVSMGLQWGGKIGLGGVRLDNPNNDLKQPTGLWLQYANIPKPIDRRRTVISSLPSDFTAAFSSFAPTRDDSVGGICTGTKNRVWWEREGGRLFQKMFGDDQGISHMNKQYDTGKGNVFEETTGTIGDPMDGVEEEEEEEDEEEDELFRKAVESFEPEELPLHFSPLDGEKDPDPDKQALIEISNLLETLSQQQYIRLSTAPPTPPPTKANSSNGNPTESHSPVLGTPATPSPEEVTTYNMIKARLTDLISRLPPHLVATIDGSLGGDLGVSTRIPILSNGPPSYKGKLPSDDSHLPKISTNPVAGAAIAAMNAAAGLSPIQNMQNAAPVAMMGGRGSSSPITRQNIPVNVPPPPPVIRLAGAPHVSVGHSPAHQYHGHHIPSSSQMSQQQQQQQQYTQQYHGHHIPQSSVQTQGITTPHHYPTPYAPTPSPYNRLQQNQPPPPPRVVSPLQQRQSPQVPQFHGHSMPPQQAAVGSQGYQHQSQASGFGVYPNYPTPTSAMQAQAQQHGQPRTPRVNVPPPQGLGAIGVGSPANAGLRMGVQHTQQSMGSGLTPGGRYAGRSQKK